jgi:hypothetical protein
MKNIILDLTHETACAMQDAILAGLPHLKSKLIRDRIQPGCDALAHALRGNFEAVREKSRAKKSHDEAKAEAKKKVIKKPVAKKVAPVKKTEKPVAKKTTKREVATRKPPVKKVKSVEVRDIQPANVPMPVIPEVASSSSEEHKAA